ncbi:MAG: TetR/AcrR family transcriptional regulator [Acidobacteria bacterium]|nr:TetR/AcrR family transcriptional regulator [Acidobacteriota bacterium]
MTSKSALSRAKILNAARATLESQGARALTLNQVAAKAQVSKGGLTHHFKSKQELLLGLFDLVAATMIARIDALLSEEPDDGSPGRFTRAYLRANLQSIQTGEALSLRSLLEMLVAEPAIAPLRRAQIAADYKRLETDCLPPMQALAIATASDGCLTEVLIGFCDAQDPKITLLHDYLLSLTRHPLPLPEARS